MSQWNFNMETQTEILVVGTNDKILQTVLRLLNTNVLWKATGVSDPVEVLRKCRETNYEVFLIGAGLSDTEEAELTAQVKVIHPAIHVIPHYGGGSGLLFAEIYLALGTRNQAQ
jgi:DNA-binding NtrC family response regulator